jgi:pyruvyltransferase
MSNVIHLWWSGGGNNEINYGDSLSPIIIEILSGKTVRYASSRTCDMVAIGSILEDVSKSLCKSRWKTRWKRLLRGKLSPVSVWGSGSMFRDSQISTYNMRILSVRGKLTASRLKLAESTPVGDPGILADLLLRPGARKKEFRWGIVPHYADFGDPKVLALKERTPRSTMINLKGTDLRETTRQISVCDYIASSSLHGLIAADALGIPNVHLIVSNRLSGGVWKFDDYRSSLGDRPMLRVDLNEGVDLTAIEKAIEWGYSSRVDLLKEQTLAAFKASAV